MMRRNKWDFWICSGALGLLAVWDAAGWDMALMRSLGDANGFIWRSSTVLTQLHLGSRVMAWLVLAWQGWMAFGPQRLTSGKAGKLKPQRANQRYWFAVTLVCVAAINVIKYSSHTSCPWDLAEFGGAARHVSHWLFWLPDGGPGQCFPSGHSSAAFSFFTLYFVWRGCNATRAKRCVLAVCAFGLAFSLTQIVRGAHYPSHALWTAWLCWTICCVADQWRQRSKGLGAPQLTAGQRLQLKVD